MTIKQFIEKAIEGGWKGASVHEATMLFGKENFEPFVNGYGWVILHEKGMGPDSNLLFTKKAASFRYEQALLDPEAWKAVGKVEGWEDHRCEQCHDVFPEYHNGCVRCGKSVRPDLFMRWHQVRMIDALAEGKTIEQYLETL